MRQDSYLLMCSSKKDKSAKPKVRFLLFGVSVDFRKETQEREKGKEGEFCVMNNPHLMFSLQEVHRMVRRMIVVILRRVGNGNHR